MHRKETNMKHYYYNVQTNITRAMNKYNKIMPGDRFTTLDGNILNLIRTFTETGSQFYMSNKELSEVMIANPSTIQHSIDRLIAVGLVKKEIKHQGPTPQRHLTYQKDAVEEKLLNLI